MRMGFSSATKTAAFSASPQGLQNTRGELSPSPSSDNLSSSEVINLGESHVISECRVWWDLLDESRDIIKDAIIRCGLCCMDSQELGHRRSINRIQPLPWPRWIRHANEGHSDFDEVRMRNENVREGEKREKERDMGANRGRSRRQPTMVYHVPAQDTDSSSGIPRHTSGMGKQKFITLTRERRMEPFEILFDVESGRSLAHLLLDTILQCPMDARANVVNNIVVAGFLADVPGFKARIFRDVQYLIENKKRYGRFRNLYQKMRVYNTNVPGDQMVETGRRVYETAWSSFARSATVGDASAGMSGFASHGTTIGSETMPPTDQSTIRKEE
eukprot:CAMPEP_0117437486 /NCGR_PEP_ID=MMETSP0759-20121206/1547_1 /TAXON_ID=63605 /ORGANISM="Percolomonas cosmopolitus, Strain WS" /LENGTH=329 /DNA_ID=CAMNT_0005229117 /DNA_START=145 /DNA_END=1131 /DNA_ORIENTATION=-